MLIACHMVGLELYCFICIIAILRKSRKKIWSCHLPSTLTSEIDRSHH